MDERFYVQLLFCILVKRQIVKLPKYLFPGRASATPVTKLQPAQTTVVVNKVVGIICSGETEFMLYLFVNFYLIC